MYRVYWLYGIRRIITYFFNLSDQPGMKGWVSLSEGSLADQIIKIKERWPGESVGRK